MLIKLNVNRMSAIIYAGLAAGAGVLNAQPGNVDLQAFAAANGLTPLATTNAPAVSRWKSPLGVLTFTIGSRKLTIGDRIIWLNGGATTNGTGGFAITKTDADSVIRPLLKPRESLAGRRAKVVVLDAGHGGKDPGAIGCSQVREKAVAFDVSRRVAAILRGRHIEVKMTRRRETFVDLEQRPVIAKEDRADLFVSIHANQAGSKSASGVETYVVPAAGYCSTSSTVPDAKSYCGNTNDAANTVLAAAIQKNLLAQTGARDRGLKRARYLVIKNAPCPAALVEVGFLTNEKEARNIIDPVYREKIASGIADGILEYIKYTADTQEQLFE